MKNEMCLALIILAMLPASGQHAPTLNSSAKGERVAASTQDYQACVEGLLREVHASLQNISERLEAGSLTPEQARDLKLAATRDVIARLDAISAVYDARRNSANKPGTAGSVVGSVSAADSSAQTTLKSGSTVSVKQLRREQAAAAVAARSSAELSR